MSEVTSESNVTDKDGKCKIILPWDYEITENTKICIKDKLGNPLEGAKVSNIVRNNYEYEFFPSDKDGVCRLKCIYEIHNRQVVDEKGNSAGRASSTASVSQDKKDLVVSKLLIQEFKEREPGVIKVFRAEKFTFRIVVGDKKFKIFKIQFNGKNGAIFIHFPYFKNSNGIVGKYVITSGKLKSDIRLSDNGKVTSHLVKYSHPLDGNAHLSQDGKVVTQFFNKSFMLRESFHLGSLYLRGLEGFKYVNSENKVSGISGKDQIVDFNLASDNLTNEFKILINISSSPEDFIKSTRKVVSLNPLKFSNALSGESIGPQIKSRSESGSKNGDAFLISPPLEYPNSKIILRVSLYNDAYKLFSSRDKSELLIFVGGFNKDCLDLNEDATGLMMVYPAENYEDLLNKIGTIDFNSLI